MAAQPCMEWTPINKKNSSSVLKIFNLLTTFLAPSKVVMSWWALAFEEEYICEYLLNGTIFAYETWPANKYSLGQWF